MNRSKHAVVAGVLLLGTAGCANTYEKAAGLQPEGSEFNKSLYSGYMELATDERSEYDWRDSDGFARKASEAAAGEQVAPADLNDWSIPETAMDELAAARSQLIKALDRGVDESAPQDAAQAQVMFDCWVQEQEENIQPKDISRCRDGFSAAMASLDNQDPKPLETAAAPAAEPAPLPGPFIIYFDLNSSELNDDARKVLADAFAAATATPTTKLQISGHADRAGTAAYNQALSAQRANTVGTALTEMGLDQSLLTSRVSGEEQNAVSTSDGIAEALNRRVEIELVN